MAEFVEQRIEETIPEIEEMERIGLLTGKEVKKLIQKRRDFHYRLARRSKNKCDFINYVDYERKLIELIRIRRKQIGIHEKRQQIEKAISQRVMKLIRFMTRVWPSHLDTWKVRTDFAGFIGWKEEISTSFTEQVRYHGNCESVWVAWAKWEVESRKNFDRARAILLSKAQLYHPKSCLIKRELFRLELLYIESLLHKMKNDTIAGLEEVVAENREKVLNCAVVRAIYQHSVTTLPEPELYMELYEIADKFEFAHMLRDEIYRDVSMKFPDADCVWKLKAKRRVLGLVEIEHEGLECSVELDQDSGTENNEEVFNESEEDSDSKVKETVPKTTRKMEPMEKLACFISTFDDAIRVVGECIVKTYLNELLPLLYQCWGATGMSDLIFKKVLSLSEAHTEVLSPLHFFIWESFNPQYQVLCEQSNPRSQMRVVLEDAIKYHPEELYLKLELVKLIIREAVGDADLIKEFDKMATSLKGDAGLKAWQAVISHITNDDLKNDLFTRASNHEDVRVAQVMRVHHLKQTAIQKGIKSARELYNELRWKPPFDARLHALMVELELAQVEVNAEKVRQVFNIAVQQHGTKHPGLWLAYVQFERLQGDPLRAGGLITRAEKELKAKHAQIFRELHLTIRELLGKEEASPSQCQSNEILVENVEHESCDDEAIVKPALVTLFEEELMLSHTADQAQKKFFSSINTMEKLLNKGDSDPKVNGSEWEHVLEILIGSKVVLSVQQVKVEDGVSEDKPSGDDLVAPRFKKQHQPSDQLRPEEDEKVKIKREDDIEKILESSAILKAGFMKRTRLSPYFISKKKAKEKRRRENEKTKGPGWFNMKAPRMTEEVKQDLEVLQMRSVLDPKRHFKTNEMKVLPKYFQMGRVVDNPVEFYSSRIPKKNRKRTIAEEIIHDEETLRYQKRKYNEIISKKQKKRFLHHSQGKKTNQKGKKKHKGKISE